MKVAKMKRKVDAQSTQAAPSPVPSSSHCPSFFGASLQSYIQDALKKAVDTVLTSNASIVVSNEYIVKANEVFVNRMEEATDKLVTTVEDTLKTLLSRIDHNFQVIFQQQDEHEKRINKLEKNMDELGFSPYETFVPSHSASTHITEPPLVSILSKKMPDTIPTRLPEM
ncbi:hypothetical protein K1719_023985 [Acacia pycnantha]|nr:hypothetical protein K1719_023985 [Acacia pycnantha]